MTKEATKTSDVISDALLERFEEALTKAETGVPVPNEWVTREELDAYWEGYAEAMKGVIAYLEGDEEGLI